MSNKVVFSNAELYEKVFPGNLASLIIEGYWDNVQYTDEPVDTTGLNFKAVYDNKCIQNVNVSISPSSWGSTAGSQTVTFSYTEDGVTKSVSRTVNVEASSVGPDPVLNNNDWATIKSVADSGTAAQYWSVGDYKEVSVAAGKVDNMNAVAGTYRAVIIGINHNPTYENPNSIDFAVGQDTNGVDICFRDGGTGVRMNASNTTAGGWTGSQMYLTYLPQFYNLLSGNTGLQEAMIVPKKYTHNYTGGSGNNSATYVTLSENASYKMFLMAEFEIFGSRSYANSYEQNKQMQYAYYSSSGLAKSKIRYRTDTGAASVWWERSASCYGSTTNYFCYVITSGGAFYANASYARGLCPCFRV